MARSDPSESVQGRGSWRLPRDRILFLIWQFRGLFLKDLTLFLLLRRVSILYRSANGIVARCAPARAIIQKPCQIGLENWRAPGGAPPSALISRQPAYKPGSGQHANGFACVTAIPLGRRLPGASSNLPGRQDPDTIPKLRFRANLAPSLFGLAPGGVCPAAGVTAGAVRSYRTISPLPWSAEAPRRYVFCGTVPGFAPAGCYPAPFVRGARTFLSDNLSVSPERPSDRLTSNRDGDIKRIR